MAGSFTTRLGNAPEEGIKAPCVVATSANITLSGEQTINTVTVVAGNRVLVRGQTDPLENGIYDASTSAWTRTVDWNAADDVISGVLVLDAHTNIIYQGVFTGEYTVGTTSVSFNVVGAPYDSNADLQLDAVVKTTAFTVATTTKYLVDTSGGGLNITMPSSPTVGDRFGLIDITGSWSVANPVTLLYNATDDIMRVSGNYLITTHDSSFVMIFTTSGWVKETIDSNVTSFSTVALLQANLNGVARTVDLLGYYAAGDGGGGTFWFDTSDTSTADDGGVNIVDAQSPRAGTWKRLYSGAVNVQWFGTDFVDDTDAITAALVEATGKDLVFPSGTYVVSVDALTMFTPGQDTTIRGVGDATIRFNLTDTTTRTLFTISNSGVTFRDLKVEIGTSVINATIVGFRWGASNLTFDNVEVDGSVVGDTGTSHLFQLLTVEATGSYGQLSVINNHWHDCTRFWLRANTDTASISDIRFIGNKFERCESSMFAMNTPQATTIDVMFSNNEFLDAFLGAQQADQYCIGPQVTNCTITGNTFRGAGHECIHIEEDATNIVIANNVIQMDLFDHSGNPGRAIYVSDNNIVGGASVPERVIITGNVIKRADSGKSDNGIELVNDGDPEPINNCVIVGNTIEGWNYGIVNGSNQDDIIVCQNNVIENCTEGLRSQFGMPGFANNILSNCTTGITTISGGGMFGRNTFYNNGTNVNAASGQATLLGMDVRWDRVTFTATGDTDFVMFGAGAASRFHGFINVHAYANDTSEDMDRAEISWDGTGPLVQTNEITYGGGALLVSYLVDAGSLKVRVANSGSALSNGSVYTSFDGMVVVA